VIHEANLPCYFDLPAYGRPIHPECMPPQRLNRDCLDCDDYGTIATRDNFGGVSGYVYCLCSAGTRRAQIEAARDDATLADDINRALWPLSLDILASPTSLTTAARPVGLNSRPLTATWPGRPPG